MNGPRVIVIGAGLAGLAAARRLRAGGCAVQLLERRGRAGGRATSDERDGFVLDSGPHWIGARDRHLLALVEEAGLAESHLPLRPAPLLQVSSGSPEPIDPTPWRGVARIPGVRWLEAFRLRRLARLHRKFRGLRDPLRPELAARLDDRSAADFARLYFGNSVAERYLAPWLAGDLQADANEASRLLWWMHEAARLGAPEGRLRGPLGSVASRLADPALVEFEVEVRSVRGEGQRIAVEPATGNALWADAVVLATPAAVTRQLAAPLLATAERELLAAARSAPAIVAAIALDRPLDQREARVRVPPCEHAPLANLSLETGIGRSQRVPIGAALALATATEEFSSSHLEAPDEVVEKALVDYLDRLYPGAAGAVRFCALRRLRDALPRFDVGRFRAIAQLRKVGRDRAAQGRRLYLAGDHLVAPTLEGAVVSGLRAADEALADLGVGSGRA